MGAVGQGLIGEGAGVDRAHGVHEGFEPIPRRALVGAEDAFIFSGEGVAVGVLQEAGGTDDDGRLAEILEHLPELGDDLVGEHALQEPRPHFLRRGEGDLALDELAPVPPGAVLDEIGVEDVRTDEERVVRLEQVPPGGVGGKKNGARQKHAGRFPADAAGADEPLAHGDQVGQGEISFGQLQQARFMGDGHVEQLVKQFGLFRPRGRSAGLLVLEQLVGLEKVLGPDVGFLQGEIEPGLGHGGEYLGDDRTALHGGEGTGLPTVEEVHGLRVPLEYLEGMEVDGMVLPEDVHHHLGGGMDGGGGHGHVMVAQERKVGGRFIIVEVGAGEQEEIAQHAVGVPVGGQVGEAVEDVTGALAELLDHVEDGGDEDLEALIGIEPVDVELRIGVEDLRVVGEAEVNKRPFLFLGAGGKGMDEGQVLFQVVHLEDNIVPGYDPLKHRVQFGEAGAHLGGLPLHRPFTIAVRA